MVSEDLTRVAKLLETLLDDQERAFKGGIVDESIAPQLEAFCEAHGYGNVIATASALWREKDPRGAFCYGPCAGIVQSNLLEAESLGLIKRNK